MWLCVGWLAVTLCVCAWAVGHSMRIILTWIHTIDVCVGKVGIIVVESFTCSPSAMCVPQREQSSEWCGCVRCGWMLHCASVPGRSDRACALSSPGAAALTSASATVGSFTPVRTPSFSPAPEFCSVTQNSAVSLQCVCSVGWTQLPYQMSTASTVFGVHHRHLP